MKTVTYKPVLTYKLQITVKELPEMKWRFSVVHRNNRTCYYTAWGFTATATRDMMSNQLVQGSWTIMVHAIPVERDDAVYDVTQLFRERKGPEEISKELRRALVEAGVVTDAYSLCGVLGES